MRSVLTDLHLHSTYSDGKLTVAEIAITDHLCESATFLGRAAAYLGHTLTPESFPLYQETLRLEAKRAEREYGMLLIPGFELTKNTLRNHRSGITGRNLRRTSMPGKSLRGRKSSKRSTRADCR